MRNKNAARAKVVIIWLVTVNENGIMPTILHPKMKIKVVNMSGKNLYISLFFVSLPIIFVTVSYKIVASAADLVVLLVLDGFVISIMVKESNIRATLAIQASA